MLKYYLYFYYNNNMNVHINIRYRNLICVVRSLEYLFLPVCSHY